MVGSLRWAKLAAGVAALFALGAESGALTAPAEAPAGSSIEVGWSGRAVPGDFISIDRPGEGDRSYGSSYGYPATVNPVKLTAPTEPGEYVIRMHLARDYA